MTAGRIAILLHDFTPGGSEQIAIRLANEWAGRGRSVTIIAGDEGGTLRPMVGDDVTVIGAQPPVWRGSGTRRRLARLLPGLLELTRPQLLFVPGNYHLPIVAALARRRERPAIVAKLSNPIRRAGRHPLAQRIFDATLRRRLTRLEAIVAMSPALTADAEAVIGSGSVVMIAQPSLPDHPPPLAPPVFAPVILAAGRFVEQKRFDRLLEAVARLERRDARLVLLGDGPLRVRLAAHAAQLGIADRVSMPGHVATIREMLDQARLYVVSSDYEGYPAVAIEALAAGVPVVATDCSPAIHEILCDPIRGSIVPPGDTAALAAAIDARLSAAPPARAILAATVIGHRIGPIAGQYLDLFDRITG